MNQWKEKVKEAHQQLHDKTGAGNDFLGWVDLPEQYDQAEFAAIKKAAENIQETSEILLVIGIGGSYLGARRSEEHTSELQSRLDLVCRLLLEKKIKKIT